MARFFPLHSPAEIISEVDAHRPEHGSLLLPLAVTLRTNWNRECTLGFRHSGVYTTRMFRTPRGCYINCFFLQLFGQAFGPIYGVRSQALRSKFLPRPMIPAIPDIAMSLEQSKMHYFSSCARLFSIQKVWIFYDSKYCTGLACGDYFSKFRQPPDTSIRRVWITFTEDKRVKCVEFTTCSQTQREAAISFDVTDSTVSCAPYPTR